MQQYAWYGDQNNHHNLCIPACTQLCIIVLNHDTFFPRKIADYLDSSAQFQTRILMHFKDVWSRQYFLQEINASSVLNVGFDKELAIGPHSEIQLCCCYGV